MKNINKYILERLVLSKNKRIYRTTLSNFAKKLFFSEHNISPNEYFSEDNIREGWLLPYKINDVKQDTNPDKWSDDGISEITRLLNNNADTEIDIDIQENKFLKGAWNYSFELERRNSVFKFCWTSTNDIRNEI